MLGVGKSDGNSQVHCRFVVTSSPRAVWVATILGISILYTVEIYLIVPSSRRRVVIANQDHICDFVITLLWQLHMITEVSRMWRKFGLSLSINAVIYFFTYIKEHPNFEPFIFCTLGVWFTWDFKWYVRHIHVIASLYLKVRYTIKNKPSLFELYPHFRSLILNKLNWN